MTTSQIARQKFEGIKPLHHKIILWVLKTYGPATNYGIAKNSLYVDKDNFGRNRTYMLSYYQINKRTSELLRLKKIRLIGTHLDTDGRERNLYAIV